MLQSEPDAQATTFLPAFKDIAVLSRTAALGTDTPYSIHSALPGEPVAEIASLTVEAAEID